MKYLLLILFSLNIFAVNSGDIITASSFNNLENKFVLEQWHTPTLENGWVNYNDEYNSVGYYKDSYGVVHLRGLLKNGSLGHCMFTLPEGYRPNRRYLISTVSINNIARIDIKNDGCVLPYIGDSGWFSIDNISFRTD